MFRSLLWPSSWCRTVRIQTIRFWLHKMCETNLLRFVSVSPTFVCVLESGGLTRVLEDISQAFYVIKKVLFVSLLYATLKTAQEWPKDVGAINKTVYLNIFASVHLLVSVNKQQFSFLKWNSWVWCLMEFCGCGERLGVSDCRQLARPNANWRVLKPEGQLGRPRYRSLVGERFWNVVFRCAVQKCKD
jgi:hypothetical protein